MMKKWFSSALVVAGLLISSAAFAATDQGAIRSVDPSGRSLTLSDGTVFQIPHTLATPTLQAGDEVTIFYNVGENGQNQLTALWIDQGTAGGDS